MLVTVYNRTLEYATIIAQGKAELVSEEYVVDLDLADISKEIGKLQARLENGQPGGEMEKDPSKLRVFISISPEG